ncbi:hypothetical protein M8J77_000706 [Diaphorina citri]|nr:hypothetical protein M8J77_000706 [Diaphorina citri]
MASIHNKIIIISEENKLPELKTLSVQLFDLFESKLNEEETKHKFQDLEDKIRELETERLGMEERIVNDENRIKHLIEDNDEQIHDFQELLKSKDELIQDLKRKIDSTQKTKENDEKTLNTIIERLQEENELNQRNTNYLEDLVKKLEEDKEGLKITINGLKKTIDDLENTKHQKHNEENFEKINLSDTTSSRSSNFSFDQSLIPIHTNTNNYQLNFAQELELTSNTQIEEQIKDKQIPNENNEQPLEVKEKENESPPTRTSSLQTAEKIQNVTFTPNSPEIQIYVPEDLEISPKNKNSRFLHYTESESTQKRNKDFEYVVEMKLLELEDEIRLNTIKIMDIESNITKNNELYKKKIDDQNKNNKINIKRKEEQIQTIPKPSPTNTLKNVCHIIGDSHIRYINNILSKKKELQNYEIKTTIKPGKCLKEVLQSIPSNMKDKDILVISAGTNDLYRTDFTTISNEINKLSHLKQRTILISIPPQNCQNTNRDIIRLNSKINHLCKSFKNVEILNTHVFIKPQHLSHDGIHMSKKAKEWLADKISTMITNSRTMNHHPNIPKENTHNVRQQIYKGMKPRTPKISQELKHPQINSNVKSDLYWKRKPQEEKTHILATEQQSKNTNPSSIHLQRNQMKEPELYERDRNNHVLHSYYSSPNGYNNAFTPYEHIMNWNPMFYPILWNPMQGNNQQPSLMSRNHTNLSPNFLFPAYPRVQPIINY